MNLKNWREVKRMKITVDPNTKATGFGYVTAGLYRLRVNSVEQKEGKQFPYLKWELELTDPNIQSTDGESKPGHIFENTTLKTGENAQFRLKQLCDALGIIWGDFDTDAVIGLELDAQLKIEEYQGKKSNGVDTFIPVVKA